MGQNQSTAFQNSSQPLFPRRSNSHTNNVPPPRPASPPKLPPPTPKTPTYVVPENKVIPDGVSDMANARKLLRPVSQELSKFHPDYPEIFQYDPEISFEAGDDDSSLERSMNKSGANKENSSLSLNASALSTQLKTPLEKRASTGSIPNGKLSHTNTENGPIPSHADSSQNRTGRSENINVPKAAAQSQPESGTNLRRAQSMDRERSQPQKMAARHKRQTSLTSRISIQENVILEDPREHLYNVARDEPFSNFMPNSASLPLKSSFDMEYSMNLTYAQLAEYRRLKRASELEERTGKKLENLGAEIKASSTVPKSPFDRQNLGGKSATHSVSTGSSETGVSKSKKKRAPAPPPPGPPPRDKSPSGFSLTTEPPADYDMEDVSSTPMQRRSRSLQRNLSSASRSSKSPAPQPLPKSQSAANLGSSTKTATTPVPLGKIPSPPPLPGSSSQPAVNPKSKNVSTIQDAKPLPGETPLKRSMSQAKEQLEKLKQLEEMLKKPAEKKEAAENVPPDVPKDEPETSNDNKNSDDANVGHDDNGNAIIKQNEEAQNNEKKTESHEINISDLGSSVTSKQNDESVLKSVPDTPTNPKKMSSLLQHDIMLAAQARGSKIVKNKPPPALEKPKDAAQLFREELAKAASEREERRKETLGQNSNEGSRDNSMPSTSRDDRNIVFQSNFLKVSRKPKRQTSEDQMSIDSGSKDGSENADSDDKKDVIPGKLDDRPKSKEELEEENKAIAASIDFSKRPSIQSEDMSISSSNASQRVFSPDWTPAHDLESDDDIMDEKYDTTERRVSTEGFKSSIIPPKLKELKNSKKDKKKKIKEEKREEKKRDVEEAPMDEKIKFGSIRRFKKSVHSSMKNAFGSISKASGKLLKKQKSHEFLDVSREPIPQSPSPDSEDDLSEAAADTNWEFAGNKKKFLRRTASDGYIDHPYQNGVNTSDSSEDSDEDVGDIDFADGINESPRYHKGTSLEAKSEQNLKAMKRAGIAYVSGKGQIVVLPESQTVRVDERGRVISENKEAGGHAPKLFKKKDKKYAYESTLRKQEKYKLEEAVAREIREKEIQIELERKKQQEMEKDFRRLRDLETQERLQRLQTEKMRDHITLLQQQQVRQGHDQLNSSSNDVSMSSLNGNGVVSSVRPMNSSYINNMQLSDSQYMNGNVSFGSHDYLNNSTNFVNVAPNVSQQRYSMPSFPSTNLGQPLSRPNMATTTDPVNYTSHSAPMVGGPTINGGVGRTTMPNLTPQDLTYLSDYMRMAGVTPPSNQQQWAVLLSTISYNTPGYPNYATGQAPNGFSGLGNGPDLSQIFGSGKTFDSTTAGSKKQMFSLITTQPSFDPRDVTALRMGGDGHYYKSLIMDTSDSRSQAHVYPQQSQVMPSVNNFDHGAATTTTININNPHPSQPPLPSTVIRSSDNSGVVSVRVPDFKSSGPEDRMDYLTTTNVIVKDDNDNQADNNQNVVEDEVVTAQKAVRSPVMPAKVYGPIGFRPVPFQASSS